MLYMFPRTLATPQYQCLVSGPPSIRQRHDFGNIGHIKPASYPVHNDAKGSDLIAPSACTCIRQQALLNSRRLKRLDMAN